MTITCSKCDIEKEVIDFETGRRVCKTCRGYKGAWKKKGFDGLDDETKKGIIEMYGEHKRNPKLVKLSDIATKYGIKRTTFYYLVQQNMIPSL